MKKKAEFLTQLQNLNNAIEEGNIDEIKNKTDWFHEDLESNMNLLAELYSSGSKCITQTDLILSACSHKNSKLLNYLLNETDILVYLNNTYLDLTQVEKQRTLAFCITICSDDFTKVEMLYDYWCSDMYYATHDHNTIEKLGSLLSDACTCQACQDHLKRDSKLETDVHCLIKYNAFQFELYSTLRSTTNVSDFNKNKEALRNMLQNVLSIHEKYSDLKVVRLKLHDPEREQATEDLLKEENTVYCKVLAHNTYEVYFRKVDLNVASLILENLHVLKRHFQNIFNQETTDELSDQYVVGAQWYRDVESTLYYYMYRTIEDWRLYLPAKRQYTAINNRNGPEGQKLKYDEHKLYCGPVIYFERMHFKQCLEKLEKLLCFISNNVKPSTKEEHSNQKNRRLEDNSLEELMYMRDHYSLRKTVYYIEAVENTDEIDVIIIERALQVTGEMFKSTKKSLHVSKSAEALLQTLMGKETIDHIINLRNYLSKVSDGQLNKRTDKYFADIHRQTFIKIKEELKNIKRNVNIILDTFKAILDKSLLEKGIELLEIRFSELPNKIRKYLGDISLLYNNRILNKLCNNEINHLEEKIMQKYSCTRQILREIALLQENKHDLESKKQLASEMTVKLVKSLFLNNIPNIKRTLNLITENLRNVELLNNDLERLMKSNKKIQKLSENPGNEQINLVLRKLKKMKSNDDDDIERRLKQIKDLSRHWKVIQSVLSFMLNESAEFVVLLTELNLFNNPDDPMIRNEKGSFVINDKCLINKKSVESVYKLVAEMEALCLMHKSNFAWFFGKRLVMIFCKIWTGLVDEKYSFDGIEKLDKNIFNTDKTKDRKKKDQSRKESKLQLIQHLIKRVRQLNDLLGYPRRINPRRNVLRYKLDQKFQLTIEMLLGDIANILAHCDIRLMYKSGKLQAGVDLGDIIDHGDPFLEILGDVLYPQDFATELLEKAVMFGEDVDTIDQLYDLFKDDICLGNQMKMNKKQKEFVENLLKRQDKNKWELYLKLFIPPELIISANTNN